MQCVGFSQGLELEVIGKGGHGGKEIHVFGDHGTLIVSVEKDGPSVVAGVSIINRKVDVVLPTAFFVQFAEFAGE